MKSNGYAALKPRDPLQPFHFERRELGPYDILIRILYCGVCHSDIHQARGEWGQAIFPMVPGHEIVGSVERIGDQVGNFRVGDLAGVGCIIDSCRSCGSCHKGLEQYCEAGMIGTYNSYEKDGKTPTYGGYSTNIVVDENYALKIPETLPLERVAPLLCAGITTYSPLKHWKVGNGQRLGVMGLGGLGHMAVKIGAAMGAEVTVLSTSPSKENDAKALGAHRFIVSTDTESMRNNRKYFDFIINTVSANHDLKKFLSLLRLDGTMVMVGIPPEAPQVHPFNLISLRRSIAGSNIGGIAETQEMLEFCAEHNISADVELIPIQKINEAFERMIKADVKYRFVIDMATF